jgi:hypothetical protein
MAVSIADSAPKHLARVSMVVLAFGEKLGKHERVVIWWNSGRCYALALRLA